MKQIINRIPDNTVDLDSIFFNPEDLRFQPFWVAFKLETEVYGYFILDEDYRVMNHFMLAMNMTHNPYDFRNYDVQLAIEKLLEDGHEVFMFASQKEFFTYLAKHSPQ